ncbi:hypothetical protein EGW08_010695 [Elysia chlorotica]|uniref:Serine-threonine/tyrosine-protein kinase catalytic domain-containing protein n=1 Tax=Elysia chlorotica TaxID=188477 RepID=A0A433TJ30_ELYCH|nr:hypothetical protein EGW08_010695 [Elysia chlorotica]
MRRSRRCMGEKEEHEADIQEEEEEEEEEEQEKKEEQRRRRKRRSEDLPHSSEVLNVVDISDTLTKSIEEHIYRFREKLGNMGRDERIKLKTGALKHILPYMSIKENPKEMPHAECIVERLSKGGNELGDQPKSQVDGYVDGSLEKITLDKVLGNNIRPYLECLYQAALLLEKLHIESWLIGDISMPVLHIQRGDRNGALNVFLVSVAYLQVYDSHDDNENTVDESKTTPQTGDKLLTSRAAPEVAQFGMFSPGSDIYCFGNLMWHTLMAFDCPSNMKSTFKKELMENANFTRGKVSEKWEMSHLKPKCCPHDVYQLMKDCTQPNSMDRISANRLAQQLKRGLWSELSLLTMKKKAAVLCSCVKFEYNVLWSSLDFLLIYLVLTEM